MLRRLVRISGLLLALAFSSSQTFSDDTAIRLVECEAFLCGGVWTIHGLDGRAQWPNDVVAELTVARFDGNQILIRRKDVEGAYLGLTAVYTGKAEEQRVEGEVTYTWPGHWNAPVKGKWAATTDGWSAPSPQASHAGNSQTARTRGPLPDLNGVWQFSNKDPDGKGWLLTFALVQRDDEITFVQMQTGLLKFVTFVGRLESSTSISGYSCAAAFSPRHPNCIPETVTATLLDPTHLKDAFGAALAKVAGPEDPRYVEAVGMLPPKGAKPFLPDKPFDLNGTWQFADQKGPGSRVEIKQKDGVIDVYGSFGGYPMIAGWYLDNPVIRGTGRSRNSTVQNPTWVPVWFFVENPDEISINVENGTTLLYRVTPPAANDLPCDAANQFHITRYYAWMRGRVAIAAQDEAAARCWLTHSANEGLAAGQSLLALVLFHSKTPDYVEVFRLASKSAAQGDIMGQVELSNLYREGKGTPRDLAKAQYWNEQAEHSKEVALWRGLNAKNPAAMEFMKNVFDAFWEHIGEEDPEAMEKFQLEQLRNHAHAVNCMSHLRVPSGC